jgi:hypothetical protein
VLLQFVTFFAVHLLVGLLPCSFSLSVHFILYTLSLTPQRQPHARAGCHFLITFHFALFTHGVYVFSTLHIHVVAAWFRFTAPSFTTAHIHPLPFIRSIHSIRSFLPALAFPNAQRSSKKMRQTGCRQHPATALRASCVRGTRSTRIGSHTTHRLNTSFRYSPLAFQPCYQRWLKAVFPFSV